MVGFPHLWCMLVHQRVTRRNVAVLPSSTAVLLLSGQSRLVNARFFLALRTSEWVPSWRQKHDCLLMFLIVALLLLLLLLNHNIYIYYLLIITINSSIFGMMTLLTLVFLIVVELAGYWWLRDVFFILTSRNFQPVHDYGPSGIP